MAKSLNMGYTGAYDWIWAKTVGYSLDIAIGCRDGIQMDLGCSDGVLSGYLDRIGGVLTVHSYNGMKNSIPTGYSQKKLRWHYD